MVSGIIFDSDVCERQLILRYIKKRIAIMMDDSSRILECEDRLKFADAINEMDINDFCCLEFAKNDGRECVLTLRKSFPQSPLLLLVDMTVSPKEYVRPDIMPSAIVLKPSDEKDIKETLLDFLDSVLKPENKEDECLCIDTREGVTRIPFDAISYVEACSKKVYIRTRKEEYGYYDTLDNLEKVLPDFFERCHRGYIVNTKKIQKYVGSENTIYLTDGSIIPVSRSYKGKMREVLK